MYCEMVVNDLLFVKTWKWNKRDRMKAQKTLFNNNNNNAICIAQIRRKQQMGCVNISYDIYAE